MNYREAIDYLLSLSDLERGIQKSANPTMSLGAIRSLFKRLGNPQHGRSTVHVTGSKGKGSTATMIESILCAARKRTALFTSPHLHSYRERIRFNGIPVSEQEFASALETVLPALELESQQVGADLSTFGILTAMFFASVSNRSPAVDCQIVEVGLGGSFDATNVFEKVDVAVITPISLEHTAILGDSESEIARDKVGIVKDGSTCVLARQEDSGVYEVALERCNEVGAELRYVPDLASVRTLRMDQEGQRIDIATKDAEFMLELPLLGGHQAENATTALVTVEALAGHGLRADSHAISAGLESVQIPGRLEVIAEDPLVVVDGAHNGASSRALAKALKDHLSWEHCTVVLACARDKDVRAIAESIVDIADTVVCCRLRSPRALPPSEVAQSTQLPGGLLRVSGSVAQGIDEALKEAGPSDLVCVMGSLYAVAEAKAHLASEPSLG